MAVEKAVPTAGYMTEVPPVVPHMAAGQAMPPSNMTAVPVMATPQIPAGSTMITTIETKIVAPPSSVPVPNMMTEQTATAATPSSSVGHIVRQVFFAIFLILFAVMSFVNPVEDQLHFYLKDLRVGYRLTFAGGIMVTVMASLLVLFGFVARCSKSTLVRFIGLALVGVFFVGNIVWVAGLGKLIDYTFNAPFSSLSSREKSMMVGSLLGIFFFNTSFLILCLKDYLPGGSGAQDNVTEPPNFTQNPYVQSSPTRKSHRTVDYITRQFVHLLGLILYLSMNVGVVAGEYLKHMYGDDVNTSADLRIAGVAITLVSCTGLVIVPFVASPRNSTAAKGTGFLLMFLVFLGSILMVAGFGKMLDLQWKYLSGDAKVEALGSIFGVFGFTNVFILYCLPDYGFLM
eukprot:TRINITY_DN50_c1_g2_i1.p1 TRINITY_DN50_c1_g2~~TRINITY_DN50_c1_g2_i1.p1  ORF type:complete len:401 (+),score=81.68 TRINITY_DN50_c1_g2_i1:66-1268(+)